MEYTYRVDIIDNNPVAIISKDGRDIIVQPHHPEAAYLAPWSSQEEAASWAEETITGIINSEISVPGA